MSQRYTVHCRHGGVSLRHHVSEIHRRNGGLCRGTLLIGSIIAYYQSLEFVAETRILAEMKIKNRGKKYFPRKSKLTSFFFFFFLNSPSL